MEKAILLLAAESETGVGGLWSLAGAILVFCFVLGLAYWFSKFLGTRMGCSASGHNMKVIEQLNLGMNGFGRAMNGQLLLVRIGEETYLIGVSQAGVQLLTRLEGEFEEASPSLAGKMGMPSAFSEVLKKYAASREKDKEKTSDG